VMTEKLLLERAARRSLYGAYRNPYTDDSTVRGKSRGAANTSVVFHGGRLLVLKEDARPMQLDPVTLETMGEWDFYGRLTSPTFTAHPKVDPETGEMFCFGYEAKGLATTDIAYYVVDAHGHVTHEAWLKAPYTSLLHDFAVTQDYIIFPVQPVTTDLERMKAGGPHWKWDPTKSTYLGVMPRYGDASQIKWFEGPARYAFHYFNAFNEGPVIHIDGCVAEAIRPPFMYPDVLGGERDLKKSVSRITRWTVNYSSSAMEFAEDVMQPEIDSYPQFVEFPQVDGRRATRKHRDGFAGALLNDGTLRSISGEILSADDDPGPAGTEPYPPGLNSILRFDFTKRETVSRMRFDPMTTVQECVFVPRSDDAPEGDGYLLALTDRWDKMLNELVILDTSDLAAGPIATVRLPLRVHFGIHGTWVPEHVITR
jgi:carotenoid cleavage dioxygenase-like enzyme